MYFANMSSQLFTTDEIHRLTPKHTKQHNAILPTQMHIDAVDRCYRDVVCAHCVFSYYLIVHHITCICIRDHVLVPPIDCVLMMTTTASDVYALVIHEL
jgi:hypothetical protein